MAFCELPLDLLTQPVEAWAERYFDHPTAGRAARTWRERFDSSCEGLGRFEGDLSEPPLVVLLTRVAELHERYAEWTARYTAEGLNQGLWAMFSYPGYFGTAMADEAAAFELRARAMRSLVVPYRVYVKGWNPDEAMPNGWWMLWDLLSSLDAPRGGMAGVALECLEEILAIPDRRCQEAALHGLSHLEHRDRPAVVQAWIDRHGGEGWDLRWLESCRDGEAM